MSTVCLAVMAKNEAHVIARCLLSAKPLVDSWVLLDTGSSDATREVARETMRGLPGEVIDRPWKGFAGSRAESVDLARSRADYVLVLDADDVFEYPPGARFPELTEGGYSLMIHDGPYQYPRVVLMRSSAPWRFEGTVHDVAYSEEAISVTSLEGISCRRIGGGARDADPRKYLRDAEILEAELRTDPTNTRSVFYLARSYEDAGQLPRALSQYERRVLMGGWQEEAFLAAYRAARVREKIGFPYGELARAFLEAWYLRPQRAEPLYDLARVSRGAGEWLRARSYAAAAAAIVRPREDVLFVQHEVYAWRALDELAGASAHLGDLRTAIAANRAMLDEGRRLPASERPRIEANLAGNLEASERKS